MARQMTPAQMVSAFKKWDVQLRLYPDWETRGYGPGSISDVEGIIVHHTGSDSQSDDYLKFLFVIGRPNSNPALNVPPPLCNWSTDMDGDLWLGAAEKANHAGMGSSATLNKIVAGSNGYDWRNVTIKPGADNINGNTRYYGNEVRFDGGQPMTRAQWITVVLSCAAVCDFHGWGAWRVVGHKEHTSRKPDPGNTLMYMLRRDVAAALAAGPGNWPTPSVPAPNPEDEMTPAQMAELKNFIEDRTQAYAVANNNYVRQVLNTTSAALAAEINDVDDEVAAAVKARFDALDNEFKELSDQVIAATAETVPPAPAQLPKA